ncbi:MAG: ABC transporter permease [Oscillospiraceae bacterium]
MDLLKKTNRAKIADFLMANGVKIAVLIFIVVLGFTQEHFLSIRNISSILSASGTTYLCALAISLVMFTNCIDLSIGGNIYLCAAVGTYLNRIGWGTASLIVAMLIVGTFCGLLNGLISASLKVYPMLNTVATGYVFRGLAFIFTKGALAHMPKSWNDIAQINLFGIPITVFLPLIVGVVLHIFMMNTKTGRQIYAVGDNVKTAKERGINVFNIKTLVYCINGFLCGIAAILISAQVMSVPSSMGIGLENTAMLAAVLGGVSFAGGKGKLFPGVFFGAMLYATVSNAMVLMQANAYLYNVIYGSVILTVIILDVVRTSNKKLL